MPDETGYNGTKIPFTFLCAELEISDRAARRIRHPHQDGARCHYYYTWEEAQQVRSIVQERREREVALREVKQEPPAPKVEPPAAPAAAPATDAPPSGSASDQPLVADGSYHQGDGEPMPSRVVFFKVKDDYINASNIRRINRVNVKQPDGTFQLKYKVIVYEDFWARKEHTQIWLTPDEAAKIVEWMQVHEAKG